MMIILVLFVWLFPPAMIIFDEFLNRYDDLKRYKRDCESIRLKDLFKPDKYGGDKLFVDLIVFTMIPIVGIVMMFLIVSSDWELFKTLKFFQWIDEVIKLVKKCCKLIVKAVCVICWPVSYLLKMIRNGVKKVVERIGNIKIG